MIFKIGEKVRIKKGFDCRYGVAGPMKAMEGDIVTIGSISATGSITVKECKVHWCWDEGCFEPVCLKKITKEELLALPIGTKITTDAEEDSVFVYDGEECFANGETAIDDSDIKKDLSLDTFACVGTKIVKVEKPVSYETVYGRATSVEEMTVAEIEKELGRKIKIIKEEN